MKNIIAFLFLICALKLNAQKHSYDVFLFGKKIGHTMVERIDKGNGEIQIKLNSSSEVNILLTHKSSLLVYDIQYKDGKFFSSYCKSVKDGVTEIVQIAWDGTKYVIKKGEEILQLNQQVDFSALMLYFAEPKGRGSIFSERLGQFCKFINTEEGVYECKLATGVNNIYRYKNGILYELEMSKGASVFMKLVQ